MRLFLNTDIDGVNVPFDKRIYVFEEIDCNGLKDIVKDRKTSSCDVSSKQQMDHINKTIKNMEMSSCNDELSMEQIQSIVALTSTATAHEAKSKRSITLGGILELLDGLVETPGRILVITTNHPDELDQALVRPGRVDMDIKFTKATRKDIAEMYKIWYQQSIPEEQLTKVKENQLTHAELCQLFFNCLHDPQRVVNKLIMNSSQGYTCEN
jgi:chaperone BCS1